MLNPWAGEISRIGHWPGYGVAGRHTQGSRTGALVGRRAAERPGPGGVFRGPGRRWGGAHLQCLPLHGSPRWLERVTATPVELLASVTA